MDLKQIRDDDSLIVVQEANERVRHQFYWLAEEVERLMAREKDLTGMVDRAHAALNELLAEHLNISSDAARIAKRGIWGDGA